MNILRKHSGSYSEFPLISAFISEGVTKYNVAARPALTLIAAINQCRIDAICATERLNMLKQ